MGPEDQNLLPIEAEGEKLSPKGQDRREFIGMVAKGLMLLPIVQACSKVRDALGLESGKAISINEQRKRISDINAKNPETLTTWSPKAIAGNLTEGMEEGPARIKVFEFVRDFPYAITSYDPAREGIGLYDYEHGDCRHKRDALFALFTSLGLEVRKVAVPFDWKDLPIPEKILKIRRVSGTKAFHSGMEIKLGGKWVYVDPTWDIGLKGAGFPINENWNGKSPTKDATFGQCQKIPHEEYGTMEDLYTRFKVPHPVKSENEAFVRALNEWMAKQRK